MNEGSSPRVAVITGGSGFIGTRLSRYLLDNDLVDTIWCLDIKKPRFRSASVNYLDLDVREPFDFDLEGPATIYNLAAVHTTPGHLDREYFETNILGAKHTCGFAENHGIDQIVFTSSISPYGASEEAMDEDSLPQPSTAYGSSKVVAEYIHRCWQAGSASRKLAIVRPGVVFGAGEGGNFTRLYKSVRGHYFFYAGRRDTRKACIYVNDLVRILYELGRSAAGLSLFNTCYPEPPTIAAIVRAMADVCGVHGANPVIPASVLKLASWALLPLAKVSGGLNGIHPARVTKLMVSTNVSGKRLEASPYRLRYSLSEALADWYAECGRKGLF